MSLTEALAFTLRSDIEGGYSNNPNDSGGATNHGVTQKNYSAYRLKNGLPDQSVKYIQDSEVQSIYRISFWNPIQGDALPRLTAIAVFDFGVNSSPSTAAKHLQRKLGLTDDGIIGQHTIQAALAADDSALAQSVVQDREAFDDELAATIPHDAGFKKGWDARCDKLLVYLQSLADTNNGDAN